MRKYILFVLFMVLSCINTAGQQRLKPFRQGDRVAFVGNSITDGGHFHSYIWLYYMTRFPEMRLWIGNLGIGGDTSTEILNRLEADVYGKMPTVVALTFGMNDSGYLEHNTDTASRFREQRFALVEDNYRKIEDILESHSARVIQVGTSPYDQTSRFNANIYQGKNDFICRMIDMQRESAKKHGWEFLDWNKPMTDYNIGKQRTDSTFTICGHDRIHPDNDGHMMMAYIFLKAQGMAGKPVATVCIDAATQSVVEATNCRLSCIERTDKGVQFDYLASALPYPLDTIARGDMVFDRPQSRIKTLVPDFMKEFDSETLRVLNLKKGSYRLTIDDVVIDTIQNYRLAAGVNLAEYVCTPQYRQALTVMMLNEDRWDMERRMRDWAWVEYDYFLKNGVKEADVLSPEARCMYDRDKQSSWWLASRRDIYAKMGNKAVRLACEKYQDSIVDEIYRVNRPVTRHIKLVRVK